MATQMTWEMLSIIAEVKGWQLEQEWDKDQDPGKVGAVKQLEGNWTRFKKGDHPFRGRKKFKKYYCALHARQAYP